MKYNVGNRVHIKKDYHDITVSKDSIRVISSRVGLNYDLTDAKLEETYEISRIDDDGDLWIYSINESEDSSFAVHVEVVTIIEAFNLKNSRHIYNRNDMDDIGMAVSSFIYEHELPSYSYPEVYAYFVERIDGIDVARYGHSERFLVNGEPLKEWDTLADQIRHMHKTFKLFFQRKNKEVSVIRNEIIELQMKLENAIRKSKKVIE